MNQTEKKLHMYEHMRKTDTSYVSELNKPCGKIVPLWPKTFTSGLTLTMTWINFLHQNHHKWCTIWPYSTCGYRSKSICRCPCVGCGVGNSYPVHISNNKCPKQIISMFSISGAHRTPHTIELTRECKPSKPFSIPDNLQKNKIN